MRYFIKEYIEQFIRVFLKLIMSVAFTFGIFISTARLFPGNLQPLSQAVLAGLWVSFLIYYAGMGVSSCLIESLDAQLIPFTPLTPRRLLLQNCKHNLVFLFVYIVLNPLFLLLIVTSRIHPPHFKLSPLTGFNVILGYLVILLFPLHLSICGQPGRWSFFFFIRRLLVHLLELCIAWPIRQFKALSVIWLLGLGVLAYFFHAPVCLALLKALDALVGLGLIGHGAFFCLSPFSGLIFACQPGTPPEVEKMQAIILSGLLLCILRQVVNMVNVRADEWENEKLEWWQENREKLEEAEAWAAAVSDATTLRPWAGNSRREGFAPSCRDEDIDLPPTVDDDLVPDVIILPAEARLGETVSFPSDVSLDYQTGFPATEQVRRHVRYWHPPRNSVFSNPWLYGSALVLAVAARLAGVAPPWESINPAVLAVLIGSLPVIHLTQISMSLEELIPWSILVPLRWPAIILEAAFMIHRRRLAMDLGMLLAFVVMMDFPLALLPLFPVLFIINRLTLGLLYWFHAWAQSGGNQFPFVCLSLPYLALWLISTIILAGMFSKRGLAGDKTILVFMGTLFAGMTVLLILGGLFALLLRFRSDTQVVAPPGFKMVR